VCNYCKYSSAVDYSLYSICTLNVLCCCAAEHIVAAVCNYCKYLLYSICIVNMLYSKTLNMTGTVSLSEQQLAAIYSDCMTVWVSLRKETKKKSIFYCLCVSSSVFENTRTSYAFSCCLKVCSLFLNCWFHIIVFIIYKHQQNLPMNPHTHSTPHSTVTRHMLSQTKP
jgi:hypothetical protein